jgi:ABC-type glycerol-3-phosphate transport system substrate-binding protein
MLKSVLNAIRTTSTSTSRPRSKRHAVAVLAIVGLAATGLAGCSAPATDSGEGSATSGNVTWWSWTPKAYDAQVYIDAFNKEYPDIKVTYKEVPLDTWDAVLRPALASPSGPDLFNITPGARMQYSVNADDLSGALEGSLGSDWKSKVAPIGVTGLTDPTGKLAGIMAGSVAGGSLWINSDLFAKYDLTPPTTIDEWLDVCSVFKKNGVTCFVHGAAAAPYDRDVIQSISNSIKPGVWAAAEVGDAKWTDPTIVKALGIWKDLFSNGIMQDGALGMQQNPDANTVFDSGNAAMIMNGTWEMHKATTEGMTAAMSAAGVADPKPFPIIPIPFPSVSGSGDGATYQLYGDSDYGLALNSKSQSKAAATTFALWFGTSASGQQLIANVLNDIPSLNGVTPDWDNIDMPDKATQQPAIENLIAQASTVTEARVGLVSGDMVTAIGVAATTVAAGDATPEQAAKTLQASAEASGVTFK